MHLPCIHAAQPSHCTHMPSYDSAASSFGFATQVPHGMHSMRCFLGSDATRAASVGGGAGSGQGCRSTHAMTSTVCTGRRCDPAVDAGIVSWRGGRGVSGGRGGRASARRWCMESRHGGVLQ